MRHLVLPLAVVPPGLHLAHVCVLCGRGCGRGTPDVCAFATRQDSSIIETGSTFKAIRGEKWDAYFAIASAVVHIIVGGCTAVMCLESLLKVDHACGALIQFAQTTFVAFECLRHNVEVKEGASTLSLKARAIPLKWHLALVVMCFVGSLFSNMSHAYGVTVPLHVIFKSSSLGVNMAVGAMVMGKRYSKMQVASVLLVLVGVICVTLASKKPTVEQGSREDQTWWETIQPFIGVAMLTASLVLSACLGVTQELSYARYAWPAMPPPPPPPIYLSPWQA